MHVHTIDCDYMDAPGVAAAYLLVDGDEAAFVETCTSRSVPRLLAALESAGLTPEQAIRSAGVNAASALGAGLQLGRIAVGSLADLVIVDGDPLTDVDDALNVVGVVRNGRFFSTIGLIDRISEPPSVELFDKSSKKSGLQRAPL